MIYSGQKISLLITKCTRTRKIFIAEMVPTSLEPIFKTIHIHIFCKEANQKVNNIHHDNIL